jgi:hypothetical protein
MMIFLTFVSVDVMGRFCVSSNSLLLSMCVFGFKRPIGGIGIMGFWGYLLPCQDAVGICRPTFFINSVLDFSTSTKKGVFSCCSLFFSSFLCFPPIWLGSVDGSLFYSVVSSCLLNKLAGSILWAEEESLPSKNILEEFIRSNNGSLLNGWMFAGKGRQKQQQVESQSEGSNNHVVESDERKHQLLQAAIAQVTKQYGKESVMWLGRNQHVHVDVISTGSLTLDIALGVGGLPKVWFRHRSGMI